MNFINGVIFEVFGITTDENITISSIGGGCINQTGTFQFEGKKYFLKWNKNSSNLFEKEEKGLNLLSKTSAIATPKIIGRGAIDEIDYLCLAFIDHGSASHKYWENLAANLAALHAMSSDHFGLDFNNHIGRLPQSNSKCDNWIDFFIEERLKPQIILAEHSSLLQKNHIGQFDLIFPKLKSLFPIERPALLHGDLWSGNVLCGQHNTPYVFDPAVYFGHREAELSFTKMFGGFDQLFYEVYHEIFPLENGFEDRIELYNLYPSLVHLNLFGSSYLASLSRTLKRFT